MNEQLEPRPEEKGALAPPNRRPPTAVGVSTPPPPPPFRRIVSRKASRFMQPLYIFTATSLAGGAALFFLAPWILLRASGATLAAIGLFFSFLIVWIHSGAAAAWSSRREYRAIEKHRNAR